MNRQYIDRAGRKAQILMAVFERQAGETMVACTPYTIAKKIGLKPSTHVRKMITELVESGWLNEREQYDLFNRKHYLVWLTNDAYDLLHETYASGNNSLKFVKGWFE